MSKIGNYPKLSEAVYNVIKQKLISQNLAPGTKVNEEKLAEELGVSRTPIREAIHKLEREGLMQTIRRYGAFVTTISSKDVQEIYEIREVLEGIAIRSAVSKLSKDNLLRIKHLLKRCEGPVSKGDFALFIKVDAQFHDLIIKSSQNARLIQIMENLNNQIRLARLESFSVSGRAKKALKEHQEIIEIMLKRDSEKAERLTREHSRKAKRNIFYSLKRK